MSSKFYVEHKMKMFIKPFLSRIISVILDNPDAKEQCKRIIEHFPKFKMRLKQVYFGYGEPPDEEQIKYSEENISPRAKQIYKLFITQD